MMTANEQSSHLDRLIDTILNTKFEDLPGNVVAHGKNRLMDVIGCMICGANDTGNPELLNYLRDRGGKPEARVFVHGDKLPAETAAQMNCIMARSFDYEPVSPVVDGAQIPGHISGSTTMTALTLGDMLNVSGKELLTAMLLGDNMATRVLLAGTGSGTRRGFDHVGQANTFGAAAIAARLLGLDRTKAKHAFGLLLDHLGGAQQMISDTATGFKLSQGNAARDAIFCANLAKAGWSGVDDVLLGEGGYYAMFTDGIKDPDLLTKDLGRKFYSDGTFKPYPNCRMNHAAIDCAMYIVEQGVKPEDIDQVYIFMSPGAMHDIIGKPFRIKNSIHVSAGFSVQYSVVNVLLRGNSLPQHYTDEAVTDPAITGFLKKVNMGELTEGDFESGRVRVMLRDGRVIEKFTEIASGDYRNPVSEEYLLNKFRNNIVFSNTVSKENSEKIINTIREIETLDNAKDLVDLMVV